MIYSNNCTSLICSAAIEGFRSAPYKDNGGVPTIGYGTTIYSNGIRVTLKDKPISKEQALKEVEYRCAEICKNISKLITVELNQNQIDAIVCFVYNEGIGRFSDSTLLKVINKTPHDFLAVKPHWLEWVYGYDKKTNKHMIINGLVARRTIEFNLYCNPI